jgi:nucleoside-diphosphate-sugar epimerase
MMRPLPTIAILGASGLIGEAVAVWLSRAGFPVVAIARRFSSAQRTSFDGAAIESKIVDLDAAALDELLDKSGADIVVNCIGILQDGPQRCDRYGPSRIRRTSRQRFGGASKARLARPRFDSRDRCR